MHTGRSNDIYLFTASSPLGVTPKDKWMVVASTRVEGELDADALAVAKRELVAVLPVLKPAKKLFAELLPYYEPTAESGTPNLHVCASCDATSHFDSVEAEVLGLYEQITGEPF